MSELYKSRALVVFRHACGEADEIVRLLTPDRGRLDAVVRGSKKINSGWTGKVEPFVELQGLFAPGRSLDYLTQAEVVCTFAGIRANYERLCWGGFLLELFAAAVAEGEARAEYALLWQTLRALERAERFRLGCCWAEWNMLRLNGHALHVDNCVICGDKEIWGLSLSAGGVVCRRCGGELPWGESREVQRRLLAMLRRLPYLTLPKAVSALVDDGEMRLLEKIVWEHWCFCGLPQVKARRLVEGLA